MATKITSNVLELANRFCEETGLELQFPGGKTSARLQVAFNGKKIDVDWYMFQMLPQRWINGEPYYGPVYQLGGVKVVQVTMSPAESA